MTTPIEQYAYLSDCRSGALVGPDGAVEWWCVPRFDSPSVFGRLLDPDAGHWSLGAVQDATCEREYAESSLVLRSTVRTEGGEVMVTDALLFAVGARGHDIGKPERGGRRGPGDGRPGDAPARDAGAAALRGRGCDRRVHRGGE